MALGTPQELERSVSGRKTVIQLEQASEPVSAALKKITVRNISVDGNKLSIDVVDPEKENGTFVDAVVRAGGHIQSVNVVGSTLEDAYLNLVRKDK